MMIPYRRRRYPSSLGFPSRSMRSFDASSIMKTDISQTDAGYELTMELPGFSKDDVQAELKDGYLIVSAQMSSEIEQSAPAEAAENESAKATDEQDQEQDAPAEGSGQTWVRRERFFGNCQRSFYLGEEIAEEGITAKFENGLLMVSVPKSVKEAEPEPKKLIAIEG